MGFELNFDNSDLFGKDTKFGEPFGEGFSLHWRARKDKIPGIWSWGILQPKLVYFSVSKVSVLSFQIRLPPFSIRTR